MDSTRTHPETGETLYRGERQRVVTYGAASETVLMPGWYPRGDGDSLHTSADCEAANEAYIRLRATTSY